MHPFFVLGDQCIAYCKPPQYILHALVILNFHPEAFIRTMRFVATFTSLVLCVVSSAAQYDIGISGGVFSFQLNNKAKDRYRPTAFSTSQLPWRVSAWYRERGEKAVGLQVELQWMQKAFHTEFSSGGLGSGTNYSEDVVAQFVHFHIGPEIQIGQRKLFQFRTGPQIGILVGGTSN